MVVPALFGLRRSAPLGWTALIILVAHSLIAHKEVRYIYPLVPLVVTLAACGFVEIAAALKQRLRAPLSPVLIITVSLAFCALTSVFLASRFTFLAEDAGGMIAFDQLSQDSTLCGVGLYGAGLFRRGGYTHLHRDVPIVLVREKSKLAKLAPSFNALLTYGKLPHPEDGFQLSRCWNGVCLYRRAGPCAPAPQEDQVNAVLRQTGD